MLDCHGARVEEDEDDDEPEPPLLLAHPPDADSSSSLLRPELAAGTWKKMVKKNLSQSPIELSLEFGSHQSQVATQVPDKKLDHF